MHNQSYLNYNYVTITCICGYSFKTKSTKQYNVDVCSHCHPFFTGKEKMLDTDGRIEKFQKKYKYQIKNKKL